MTEKEKCDAGLLYDTTFPGREEMHPGSGYLFLDVFFYPLRAKASVCDLASALRTLVYYRVYPSAYMADQSVGGLVPYQVDGAVLALKDLSAVLADAYRRIASPVNEHYALLAKLGIAPEPFYHLIRNDASAA